MYNFLEYMINHEFHGFYVLRIVLLFLIVLIYLLIGSVIAIVVEKLKWECAAESPYQYGLLWIMWLPFVLIISPFIISYCFYIWMRKHFNLN